MNLEYTFEASPLLEFAQTLQPEQTFPAEQLLALAAQEDRQTLEQALEICREKGAFADVSHIRGSCGQAEARLLMEEGLAKQADMLSGLEENDPLGVYLRELSSIPVAGDVELISQLYLDGQTQVAEQLVNLSLSLVVEISREMTGKGVLLLDLIQEGSLGLWQGIAAYEGGNFTEHIRRWIYRAMADAVVLQACENGLGDKLRRQMEDYRDVDQRLLSELGRNPSLEEIAQGMHVSVTEAEYAQSLVQNAQALSRAKEPEQDAFAEEEDQAVENTAYYQSRQLIFDMLSTLEEQEKTVVSLRYGLETGNALTAQQVAQRLGISPEQVMTIEADALAKMRNN